MSNFRLLDRQTGFLLPPSVDDWLAEKHLARFVVELINSVDLSAMRGVSRFRLGELLSAAFAGHFWFAATPQACFQPQTGAGDV